MIIRKFANAQECHNAVAIQQDAWGLPKSECIPGHFLVAANSFAEQWGAFDTEGNLLGFFLAYPTAESSVYYVHMMGVSPKEQGKKIGQKLFREMFRAFRTQGIKKVYWVYDPFDFRNSSLYLNKVGAKGTQVISNYYGEGGLRDSSYHGPLTHRMKCEYYLNCADDILFDPSEEQSYHLPISAESLRTNSNYESAHSTMDQCICDLQRLIEEGWIITSFTPTSDNKRETGAFILKKRL